MNAVMYFVQTCITFCRYYQKMYGGVVICLKTIFNLFHARQSQIEIFIVTIRKRVIHHCKVGMFMLNECLVLQTLERVLIYYNLPVYSYGRLSSLYSQYPCKLYFMCQRYFNYICARL